LARAGSASLGKTRAATRFGVPQIAITGFRGALLERVEWMECSTWVNLSMARSGSVVRERSPDWLMAES